MEESEIRANFSKNIVTLRKSRGLNQAELGKKLSYSDKAISKWENGDTLPDIVTLKRIADLFDITLDQLISDSKVVTKTFKRRNRLLITSLSASLPFLAAAIVMLILVLCGVPKTYTVFPIAFAASFVVLIVFTSLWYGKFPRFLAITGFIWSGALIAMFFMDFYLFWIVLTICAITNALFAVFMCIKFTPKEK